MRAIRTGSNLADGPGVPGEPRAVLVARREHARVDQRGADERDRIGHRDRRLVKTAMGDLDLAG